MEKSIDRKEYRRNSDNNKVIEEEQIEILQKKIKIFLYQVLGASLIILIISFLKYYNSNEILEKIKGSLTKEITISSLQKSGQIILYEGKKYYNKLNDSIEILLQENEVIASGEEVYNLNSENIVSEDNVINNNLEESSISYEKYVNDTIIDFSTKQEYESAVEGINQMSEDAEYIKENYKMSIPVIGTITSEFGVRNSENPKVSHYHSGLDIAANTGTQILAALDGKVIEAANDTYYGKYLKIQKDDITIIYAHCSKLLVNEGDNIKRGSLIALVGNTGNSTGPHVHLEIKYKDRLVNPLDIIEM